MPTNRLRPDERMMRRIVATTGLPPNVEAQLRDRFALEVLVLREIGSEAFLAWLGEPDALVVAPGDVIDAALIAALPASVKMIASYSTGIDHIDIAAADARGIAIARTPGVLTDATADIAMLLILMTVRGAAAGQRLIAQREWQGWRPDQIFGHDLAGRVLGIVGPGAIGLATARRAQAFGMEIIYWGRSAREPFDAIGARAVLDWEAFLGVADVVSLHVPSTAQTRNLIDAAAIGRMRRGACLINTARGDLIDDNAVLAALSEGRLGGVGLDVIRGEPDIDPRWYTAPNCVLLPHIGSATHESRAAMGDCVIKALTAHLAEGSIA